MKNTTFKIKPLSLALLLAGIGMAQASYAVNLVAIDGQWSPDGGTTQIPMWGFVREATPPAPPLDCNSLPTWTVGPQLTDADLVIGDLTINLRNCLVNDSVSIVIPGQPATFSPETTTDGDGRTRITSFTHEAVPGGTASYTWSGVRDGTYLYQSGSHPAMQVQMGLYGALTVGTDPLIGAYPNTSGNVTLLYSEIDPALHTPPAAATPLGYKPRHYLVNGLETQLIPLTAGDTNLPTVLRFLNAGLDFHVPTLNGGHMTLVAEDGNAYPFPKVQYSANLAAGKTIDALWQPASAGDHVIYDRRGNGMVASLTVAAGEGQPIANNDLYSVDEGEPLEVLISFDTDGVTPLTGVLANDTDGLLAALTVPPATASLTSSTSSGILALDTDGSFSYTPGQDFNGVDTFTYTANDGALDSNVASVTITVDPLNDAPVANDNAYDALEGEMLSVVMPGVLENDTDVDGDMLVVGAVNGISTDVGVTLILTSGATLIQNANGSLEYTPATGAGTSDSFTYDACDAEPLCDTATVNITIITSAPVAVDDAYDVIELTPLSEDAPGVLGNDTDPNGDALTAVLPSTPTAGSLTLNDDGSFVYTPDAGAVPGDTASFTYFANDGTDDSAASATVTLSIIANSPPVAVEDSATVQRNTPSFFINLTDNDSDPDSNLKDELGNVQAGQIDITTGTTTTRGGTVTVVTNGVNYTPKKNFRGTDTFSYTVTDLTNLPDAVSNEVTVRVNVVK